MKIAIYERSTENPIIIEGDTDEELRVRAILKINEMGWEHYWIETLQD